METEAIIKTGAGSQTGYSRWGDYSSMRIDPSDDCTFWYVNEYLPVTSSYGWYTHIGSFKFSGCGSAPAPDFSLSASPSSMNVTQGGAGVDSTITVTSLNGFNSAVSLAVSGCPSFATCVLSSKSVTPPANGSDSTTTLTVIAGASTPKGTSTVTISGNGRTHTTSVSVTVQPPPDYSLSASPSSLTAAQGQAKTSTISVGSIGGFNGSVSLSVSGCPANTTCLLSSSSVIAPGSSTLTITTTVNTPLSGGTPYTITISGNGGTHTTTVSLTVTPQADFGISVSQPSITISRSSSGTVTVNTTQTGGSSTVALSISGLPARTSASFTPTSVSAGGSSTLRITINRRASPGTFPLTITGNNSALSHSAPLSLTIN